MRRTVVALVVCTSVVASASEVELFASTSGDPVSASTYHAAVGVGGAWHVTPELRLRTGAEFFWLSESVQDPCLLGAVCLPRIGRAYVTPYASLRWALEAALDWRLALGHGDLLGWRLDTAFVTTVGVF